MEWSEHSDGIDLDAGDVGGDIQAGPAASRRWQRQTDDGEWQVVTVYFYVAAADPDMQVIFHTWTEEQHEYLVCTDPEDPGSTELWADSRYHSHPFGSDPAELCRAFTPDRIKWPG